MYRYDHRVAATVKLEKDVIQKANAALRRAGLDGNKRFRKIGEALSKIFSVLSEYGIEPDETLNAHKFPENKGVATVYIAMSNKDDAFSPTTISNSMVSLSWEELSPGKVEVIAYLS
jgi:hypothetical protein